MDRQSIAGERGTRHRPMLQERCRIWQSYNAGNRTPASGKGLKLDAAKGNRFLIEVIGNPIAVWVGTRIPKKEPRNAESH
jgi:hypothetical protein